MTRRGDDAWLSDAAHGALAEQTQQHMEAAQQAAAAAEAARQQAEQARNGNQR